MKKEILVVEDRVEIQDLVELTLDIADYGIHKAVDGERALELVRDIHPDLIILDVMLLGDMDGYEVCRRVKANPAMANSRVVMLTERGQETDRQKGQEAGADDYFVKPFSPLELLNKVEEILGD